jgi:probable F420-dependent oxidoreductase
VKFGLYGMHRGSVDPESVVRRARLAEQAGLESLWVGDHIALPAELGGELPRLEAVVAATYVAAVTTRVRIGIGVIVLPQRQPVLLAKQLTSVDVLSGGRLIVGVGVGYVEPEFRALGVSLADRGARTDEYLAVMRTLWTDPAPSFDGAFVSFDGVYQRPPPRQRPHPPIVVGGNSSPAFRRAVRVGHGWHAAYLDLSQTAEALAGLRRAQAGHERPGGLGELEITVTPPPGPVDLDTARRYADLGVHRLAIQPGAADFSDVEELIASIGETLVGRV